MRREGDHIYLSRRNLLALLAKLDGHPPDSRCTIGSPSTTEYFLITAEEDDVHYEHASRETTRGMAGPMHPDTEEHIRVG